MAHSQTLAAPRSAVARQGTGLVRAWLLGVAALVFLMVSVGGATRLTGSGLSITEWQPIMGIVPPLSHADWLDAFAKYQQIPQYQHVNRGMSLEAFQAIFWWEWAHRFLGRLIGVVFLVPFLGFLAAGQIPRALLGRLAGIFALGGLQGAIGWYMVRSGLAERVDVSQYRLALHLGLAIVIFGALIWVALSVDKAREPCRGGKAGSCRRGGGAAAAGARADPARRLRRGPEGWRLLQHLAADGWSHRPRRPGHHAALVPEPVRERDDRAVQSSHGRLRAGARHPLARVGSGAGPARYPS